MINKKITAIFFGGCSSEYSVSLQSAYTILKHIDRTRYVPLMIGITNSGDWYHFSGDIEAIRQDCWHNESDCRPVALILNRQSYRFLEKRSDGSWGALCFDIGFPVLHGRGGEDGTIQGMLELAGIPLAGCKTLGSALCIDKQASHTAARAAGIPVPDGVLVTAGSSDQELFAATAALTYPLYVKPAAAGSSCGLSRVCNPEELAAAVHEAGKFGPRVIIEETIPGFEVGCAVIGNGDKLILGAVDEVEIDEGIFSFEEKASNRHSRVHVPARISEAAAQQIRETAVKLYYALGCSGFARIDMFLTPSGRVVFNEVNTIPGFTEHSRFPRMLEAVGMSITEIITAMIETA